MAIVRPFRSPFRRPARPRSGFTLIELLVVISIIALLIGILLPSLGMARRSAWRVVGQSNIRQLQIANTVYANDNSGHLVLAAEDENSTNLRRWHGERRAVPPLFGDPDRPDEDYLFDPTLGPLSPYFVDGEVKRCPAFDAYTREAQLKAYEAGAGGYGYNHQFVGGRQDEYSWPDNDKHSAVLDNIFQPTATVMFADAASLRIDPVTGEVNTVEESFAWSPFYMTPDGPQTAWGKPTSTIHFRHPGQTANVAWCDGHVTGEKLSFSAPSFYLPGSTAESMKELNMGWFGEDSIELFDLK